MNIEHRIAFQMQAGTISAQLKMAALIDKMKASLAIIL